MARIILKHYEGKEAGIAFISQISRWGVCARRFYHLENHFISLEPLPPRFNIHRDFALGTWVVGENMQVRLIAPILEVKRRSPDFVRCVVNNNGFVGGVKAGNSTRHHRLTQFVGGTFFHLHVESKKLVAFVANEAAKLVVGNLREEGVAIPSAHGQRGFAYQVSFFKTPSSISPCTEPTSEVAARLFHQNIIVEALKMQFARLVLKGFLFKKRL